MTGISVDELELYSLPSTAMREEKKLLSTLEKKQKYKTALVVGRFQPLHRGHIYLIRQSLQLAEQVIICIGSANIVDHDNPFPLATREELLQRALKREGIEQKVKNIFTHDDTPEDDIWLSSAIKKAGVFDVVIGNNDWVNGLFKKAGYPVIEIPLLMREVYEGKKIRKQLREANAL